MKGKKESVSPENSYDFQGLPEPSATGRRLIERNHENYIKHYLQDLPEAADVLEVGGGRGFFAEACISQGWRYCTIEKSRVQTRALQKRGIRAINDSVPPIAMEDDSVNLVHAEQVVEHFNNHDEAICFVQECRRVLRPGGLLSIISPNIVTQRFYFYEFDYSHSYPTSRERLEWLLRDYSFEIAFSGCFLNWNNSRNMLIRGMRPALLVLFNLVRLPVIKEILGICGGEGLRRRVLKSCADNVVVIGRKQ